MGGFSSQSGVGNDGFGSVVNADNASFDGTQRGGVLTTNGQLFIGASSNPRIRPGSLTSPNGTVNIGYSAPNITLDLPGGGQALQHLTGNTGGSLNPDGSHNINIFGLGETTVSGVSSTLSIFSPSTAAIIVDPTQYYGNYQTIAAALTAASSGQTIFIRPGTYTENLTLKAGVNLSAYVGDGFTGNVTIVGNCTASFAGTCTLSGIRLQTNSANCLTVSGSSATIVNLVDCYINCSNNTGISYSSSSSSSKINLYQCSGNLGTTGIAYFAMSSSGTMFFYSSSLFNTGGSSTANTISSGNVTLFHTVFSNPITSSGTGSIGIYYSNVDTSSTNSTSLTVGGSGAHNFFLSTITSGSASCASISQTLNCYHCNLGSSNANVLTGAGTLNYSNLAFVGTSSTINVTTQTGGTAVGGKVQAPSAGFLGEQIRATVASGSAVSVSTNTGTNITSISLTAGIWDVSGIVCYKAAAITGTLFYCSVGTTSATLGTGGDNAIDVPTAPTAGADSCVVVPAYRLTLTSTTTVYLVAYATYTVGTLTAFGRISATRVG